MFYKKAAQVILSAYPSPAEFLFFVNDVIYWNSYYFTYNPHADKDKEFHGHELRMLVELIVVPWIDNRENPSTVIEKAMKEFHIDYGFEGMRNMLLQVFRAFAFFESATGHVPPKYMVKYMSGFNTLSSFIDEFDKADSLKNENREQSNLKAAA